MPDYFLSELTAKTSMVATDLIHLRTVGNIDQKITFFNLAVGGVRQILSKAANYVIAATDINPIIVCDTSGGAIELDIPALAGVQGMLITVLVEDATNTVTIDQNGAETINGSAVAHVIPAGTNYAYITIWATPNTWVITDIYPFPDDYIKTDMITDANVTVDKLGTNSVSLVKMQNDSVDTPELVADSVTQAKVDQDAVGLLEIKTNRTQVSRSDSDGSVTLPGGEAGFYPQIDTSGSDTVGFQVAFTANYSLTLNMSMLLGSGDTGICWMRYFTTSGEVFWIFILRAKIDYLHTQDSGSWTITAGTVLGFFAGWDHPCFGSGDPEKVEHPFPDYDDTKQEIIVINPSDAMVANIESDMRNGDEVFPPGASYLDSLLKLYDIDETKESTWFTEEVSVGIKGDRLVIGEKNDPVKKVIPKPTGIKCYALKAKP